MNTKTMTHTDAVIYWQSQNQQMAEYEALCKRCGICCGGIDDPCSSLKKDERGKYYCRTYDNRIGECLTVSGSKFTCVPIRDVLKYAPPSSECGYA